MGEHLVLCVDRLVRHGNGQAAQETENALPIGGGYGLESSGPSSSAAEEGRGEEVNVVSGEDEPLIQAAECRICQEEDGIKNLEIPCFCSGSLKYAHRKCVQRWCNEKGDITCEICQQPYRAGYTAPPSPPALSEDTAIDIGAGWTISGIPLDLHDPRLFTSADAEGRFLEMEYDDYEATSATGAAFFRSAALILIALLLLRHALTVPDSEGDDDTSSFSLFLLRAAGFLLPCYIMAWAISILQRRRQRQEAAALAATEVAFVLQSRLRQELHFTIAPHHPPNFPQESLNTGLISLSEIHRPLPCNPVKSLFSFLYLNRSCISCSHAAPPPTLVPMTFAVCNYKPPGRTPEDPSTRRSWNGLI